MKNDAFSGERRRGEEAALPWSPRVSGMTNGNHPSTTTAVAAAIYLLASMCGDSKFEKCARISGERNSWAHRRGGGVCFEMRSCTYERIKRGVGALEGNETWIECFIRPFLGRQ